MVPADPRPRLARRHPQIALGVLEEVLRLVPRAGDSRQDFQRGRGDGRPRSAQPPQGRSRGGDARLAVRRTQLPCIIARHGLRPRGRRRRRTARTPARAGPGSSAAPPGERVRGGRTRARGRPRSARPRPATVRPPPPWGLHGSRAGTGRTSPAPATVSGSAPRSLDRTGIPLAIASRATIAPFSSQSDGMSTTRLTR